MTDKLDSCLAEFIYLCIVTPAASILWSTMSSRIFYPFTPKDKDVIYLTRYAAKASQDPAHTLLETFRCTAPQLHSQMWENVVV